MSAPRNGDYNGNVVASRKLTDDEVKQLRGILIKELTYSPDEKEDVDDLLDYTFAMVSNGKTLSYVVTDLVSMEMDVCNESTAHAIAMQIDKYLQQHVNRVVREPAVQEEKQQSSPHIVSLKSSGEGNALTMSGALGASRERRSKRDDNRKKSDGQGKRSSTETSNRRDGAETSNRRDGADAYARDSGGRNRDDRRSGGGGGGRARSTPSEAFQRLAGSNRNDRQGRGGRRDDRTSSRDDWRGSDRSAGSRGGRGDMWHGGRGDAGRGAPASDAGRRGRPPRDMGRGGPRDSGRGGPRDMGRGGQRGSGRGGPRDMGRGGRGTPSPRGGGRGGRSTPISGTRRSREQMREDDFSAAVGRVIVSGDGSSGRGRNAGGRGGGWSDHEAANKRQRIEDSGWGPQGGYHEEYDESWDGYGGYDERYNDYNWRGGYRGGHGRGRSARGRGGRSGRGYSPSDGAENESKMEASGTGEGAEGVSEAADAAIGHPSPIVAASFGGRGYRGRGRGRGRGGRSAYRAHVASMIASKSWVRPKKDDEGGDEGGTTEHQNLDSAAAPAVGEG